jgi:DNA polymerase III sliding clamp (beta) subunit (PCNA family)
MILQTFITCLKFAASAMAKNDVRYFLNGVLMEVVSSTDIRFVGTDGKMMSLVDMKCDEPHGLDEAQYIVPNEAVKDMIKMFKFTKKAIDIPLTVTLDKLNLVFAANGTSMRVLPIDGTFPAYERVRALATDDTKARVDDAIKKLVAVEDVKKKKLIMKAALEYKEVGLSADLMARAFTGAGILANQLYKGVKLTTRGEHSAVVITVGVDPTLSETVSNAEIVVMPMKM